MSKLTLSKMAIIGAAIAALLTTGCGGSGGTGAISSSSSFKNSVMASLEQGFQAKSGAGAVGGSSRQTRSSDNVYFDDYYELWAEQIEGGINYFLDQGLTQPAGKQTYTFGNNEAGVFSKRATLEITAGKYKGVTQLMEITVGVDSFTFTYSGNNPDTGEYSAIGTYSNGASQTSVKYKDENGNDRTYSVVYNADGTSRVEFNTGANFIYTLNYAVDGSGTGTVTGNNELLPASIAWNASGDGQITFADSSTVSFTDFNFVQI